MLDFDDFSVLDLTDLKKKRFKDSCCHSYLTPKGRCFTCPEEQIVDNVYEKEGEKNEH
jgi:hypothetical protein